MDPPVLPRSQDIIEPFENNELPVLFLTTTITFVFATRSGIYALVYPNETVSVALNVFEISALPAALNATFDMNFLL